MEDYIRAVQSDPGLSSQSFHPVVAIPINLVRFSTQSLRSAARALITRTNRTAGYMNVTLYLENGIRRLTCPSKHVKKLCRTDVTV